MMNENAEQIGPASIGLPELKQPSIVIRKLARVLEVYDGERLVRSIPVVLGSSPDSNKEIEGDGRTPEGEFFVSVKNPRSRFHLSLGLSYPNAAAAERGFTAGLIDKAERDEILSAIADGRMPPQKTALGGEIYIHGGGIERDWTRGCVALDNEEMTEIFEAIPVGTRVLILR